MRMRLIRWIRIRDAKRFIAAHHRHLPKLTGAIVALGLWIDDRLVGVATLGRPARMDAADVVVITRVCTDGTPNACSMLYGKARRLAQALGFVRIKTFTQQDESGASLEAAGAKQMGATKAEHWSREGRSRATDNVQRKLRWEWRYT